MAAALPAAGEDGDVDTTFGDNGLVRLGDFFAGALGWFETIAVQADGRMVVAGVPDRFASDRAVVALRLGATGQLDSTFGTNGIATVDTGSAVAAFSGVNDIVIDADGNLLFMGVHPASASTYVARLTPAGQLDPAYGTAGIATIANFEGERIALQADGRLLVLAFGGHVVRLLPSGARDTGFAFFNAVGRGRGLAIDGSGRVVSGGDSALRDAIVVTRSLPNGTRDSLFGGMGTVTVPVTPGEVFASDLAIDPAGRIYVTAVTSSGCPAACALRSIVVRLRPDGSADPAFGSNGVLDLDVPGRSVFTRGAALLPDGRMVLAGVAGTSGGGAFFELFAVALTSSGSLDTGFALGGWQELDVTAGGAGYLLSEDRSGVAVHPSGRVALLDYNCACLTLLEAPAWTLTPQALQFAPQTAVAANSVRTSNLETVTGLGSEVTVSIAVDDGEWALDGATNYTSRPGWVSNGSRINLRHLSASTLSTSVTTTARLGGIRPKNNEALVLGATVSSAFSSTTSAPPLWTSAPSAASIAENAPIGTEVAVVTAADPDGDPVSYVIAGDSGHAAFAIDSTGRITTLVALDHEARDTAILRIQANDGKGGTATHTLTVTVTDVQEPPLLMSGTGVFSVPEDSALGTTITMIGATDPDQDVLTYTLSTGNDAGRFTIDSAGNITVTAPLDFETAQSYTLTVVVADGAGGTASGTVAIRVTDVAEPAPGGNTGGTSSGGTSSGGTSSGGGGGGGGGTDWLLLTLLALAAARRRGSAQKP